MNTPLPPSDDELVSAYLDGDVTPAERARVEGDPALLAQVERFRLVVAALREPVAPPDPARKEQAIAAALGVLDGSVVPFPAGGRPLPPPAARPTGRRPKRWLTLAAAAAVAAVVAVAGVALTSGDDNNDTASPTTETEPTGTTGTSGNSAFPPDSGVPTSPPAFGQVVDLGSFDSMDELIEAVDARPESGEPAPGRTVTHECQPVGAQAAYTATAAGDEVVVFLAPQTESRLLTEGTVYAADDCTELATFSLA